jgi:hypothetical protein
MTFGEKVITFNRQLEFTGRLPAGIHIMNPFKSNPETEAISIRFYNRFYSDTGHRFMILGINPGRLGAGATGICFTDTIRLKEKCGITVEGFRTYEPSSAFMYEMMEAFGGAQAFYQKYFLSAVCPLGFIKVNSNGRMVNFNYYDSRELTRMVYPFIVENLRKQLDFGIDTSVCFCLGTGKNENFLQQMNNEFRFFQKIVALEHPRYIMQYKARFREHYIHKYLDALNAR